jgi:hypothetical protein
MSEPNNKEELEELGMEILGRGLEYDREEAKLAQEITCKQIEIDRLQNILKKLGKQRCKSCIGWVCKAINLDKPEFSEFYCKDSLPTNDFCEKYSNLYEELVGVYTRELDRVKGKRKTR